MDKSILEYEQSKFNRAQELVDEQIAELDNQLISSNQNIKEKFEYIHSSKLDDVEIALAFQEINDTDINISDYLRSRETLKRIREKPFFARIDFADNWEENNTFYIGLKNIDDGDVPMTLDWRAPISSLLYFANLGKTSFDAPAGRVEVDMKLRRQFTVEPNIIVSYVDTNIKIDDEILQNILSKNTSSYMTNIVQTIQEEQNKIIRRPAYQSVIINGIAGSGKTSIAMHRIAYILYANKGEIKSENIKVISPNHLFSNYISEVLPELGEKNVSVSTVSGLLKEYSLAPNSFTDKMEMLHSQFRDAKRFNEINTKYSVYFFDKVNEFLDNYDIKQIILDCQFEGEPLSAKEQKIVNSFAIVPIALERTTEVLRRIIKYRHPGLNEKSLESKVVAFNKTLQKNIDIMSIMSALYQANSLLPVKGQMNYEDIPIYAYIKAKKDGFERNYFIKHLFVDEMQDYDPFTLSLLRDMYPKAVLTLVGDYNQNVLSLQRNLVFIERLFPNIPVDRLDTSYRSTTNIIQFAQSIIKEPITSNFTRTGEQPQIYKCETIGEMKNFINDFAKKKGKLAILTKTIEQARNIAKLAPDFTLIEDDNNTQLISDDKIITTIYLSKGLEYDRIMVANLDKSNFATEFDRQNLYVACTRALHELTGFYTDEPTEFIDKKYLK